MNALVTNVFHRYGSLSNGLVSNGGTPSLSAAFDLYHGCSASFLAALFRRHMPKAHKKGRQPVQVAAQIFRW